LPAFFHTITTTSEKTSETFMYIKSERNGHGMWEADGCGCLLYSAWPYMVGSNDAALTDGDILLSEATQQPGVVIPKSCMVQILLSFLEGKACISRHHRDTQMILLAQPLA
jgi:hypothetical protein